MADWAASLAPRARVGELQVALETLGHPRAHTVVLTAGADQLDPTDVAGLAEHLIRYPKDGMLFGEWCNAILDYIDAIDPDAGYVLITASDNTHQHTSYATMAAGMAHYDLVLGQPAAHGIVGVLEGPRTVVNRIQGFAFMVHAANRLRFDPAFRWWYADDDFDMQARQIGRVGFIPGTGITHGGFSPLDPDQQAHADADRVRYVQKWGQQPW